MHSGKSESNGKSEPGKAQESATCANNEYPDSLNIPCESTKRGCSLRCAAYVPEAYSVAEPNSEGKETSEPEDHRQTFNTSDDASVVRFGFREAHRHHDQVGEGDQCEDRAEEQESDLRRCTGIPVAAPPVCDCVGMLVLGFGCDRCELQLTVARQSKYEEREDCLDGAERKDKGPAFVESHVGLTL